MNDRFILTPIRDSLKLMAKYVAKVKSTMKAGDAFDYLIDLRNLEEWDPGVSSAKLAEGAEVGPNGVFNVEANNAKLVYHITDFERPNKLGFRAKTRFFTSIDFIYFESSHDGCNVIYDAVLKLNGPLSIFNFAIKSMFTKIGDKAAVGLAEALEGKIVEQDS